MIRRAVDGFVMRQRWADGLGGWLQKVYLAILKPAILKDLLHGLWLGHPLHPVITDVPVGALTAALVLDVGALWYDASLYAAANIVTLVGFVAMLAAALTGIADYTGTYGKDRRYATLHSLVMFASAAVYGASLLGRYELLGTTGQTEFGLAVLGYVLLAVGAYIGGEVVFGTGYMVDRHAYDSTSTKWQPLVASEFAEGQPTRVELRPHNVLIVRQGDVLYALDDTCAHAACSLAKGKLVERGEQIECSCHGSRFRLRDGKVVRGPATYDQPRYEVRREDGRIEVKRVTESQAQTTY